MEEEIKNDVTAEVPKGEPTAREELETLLNELLPEEKRTGDVEKMALEYIREQMEMNERLAEKLAEEPRMGQMLADVVNGARGAQGALVRYFGKSFLNADEGTPEYDEMMRAEEEYNAERGAAKAATEEFNKNFDESMAKIAPFCEKMGIDPDEFQDKIEEQIVIPLMSGRFDDNLLTVLKKGLDYDKDTNDAFVAGEVAGRNMNINEMKRKPSDGMPKGLASQTTPQEKPKVRRNPLIADALNV